MSQTTDDAPRTLADLCERYPDDRRFVFRTTPGDETSLTGARLRDRARRLGAALRERCEPGARVLLYLPDALDYVSALVACSYAGRVAVPLLADPADNPDDVLVRLGTVAAAADALLLLTDEATADRCRADDGLVDLVVVAVDGLRDPEPGDAMPIEEDRPARPAGDDPAVLLFTSGSLTEPKGVVLTHDSVLGQIVLAAQLWAVRRESVVVSWLPPSHSFGVLIGVLLPLFVGIDSVLMPPSAFVRRPADWLRAISDHGATHTGAPNFVFDYLCDHADADALAAEGISLATLTTALCAGELVRAGTYDRFSTGFAGLGLGRAAFRPMLGLSETGSIVAGDPTFLSVDRAELERGRAVPSDGERARVVAAVGPLPAGADVRVVDPRRRTALGTGQVGEIWVRHPGVFAGYFRDDRATREAMAELADGSGDRYFRTGDLAFVHDGRLFVVGREKELIIVRGENHYPVDIEATIRAAIGEDTGPLAVFGCDIDDAERVVVVQELATPMDAEHYAGLLRAIVSAVSEQHRLGCHDIVLTGSGGVVRSPIGKVLRGRTRTAYLAGGLPVLASSRGGVADVPPADDGTAIAKTVRRLVSEVFAPTLDLAPPVLNASAPFSELGLDSLQYIRLAHRVEEIFDVPFGPPLLFEFKTIEGIARFLTAVPSTARPGRDRNPAPAPAPAPGPSPGSGSGPGEGGIGAGGAVAVVGVSCRFPGGASDLDTYWRNLLDRKDCVTPIATTRPEILDAYRRHYSSDLGSFPRFSGFIDDGADFDAEFFGISPLEAESMDPQQRKALEVTWRVFEDAGYAVGGFDGERVGVFVGVHNNDYAELVTLDPTIVDVYGAHLDSGLHSSLIANRVSRWYNFRGPSEIVNTACSSSLVAVHHAVESLRAGTSSVAVVAGINLLLSPRPYRVSEQAGMLSPSGRCRTFDAGADGFVRSEGYAAVLLKPLERAVADGDHVYGVIGASAVNHDGRSNSLRAPNVAAQKELIRSVYRDARIALGTVGYIEAHGTGTALGDPIEVRALREAFRELDPDLPAGACGLGSAKASLGHLESASGIAGLLKVLQCVRTGTVPGLPHYTTPNPYLSIEDGPFEVVADTREWPRSDGRPRRAGVSSFGFGGVNAHVVVEEYVPGPVARPDVGPDRPAAILLSARTDTALAERVRTLRAFLTEHRPPLPDVGYTLQTGRAEMAARVAVLADDVTDLCVKLDAWLRGETPPGVFRPGSSSVPPMVPTSELRATVDGLIDKGEYGQVLDLWVNGVDLRNRPLHDAGGRRIPLPTYPFARDRHWLSREPVTEAVVVDRATVDGGPMLFEEVWQEQALPASGRAGIGTVVCLLSDPAHQAAFTRALRARDDRATAVFVRAVDDSTGGVDAAGRVWDADPRAARSAADVLARIVDRYGRPDAVVSLWAFEDPSRIPDYRQILHLVQAVAGLAVPRLVLSGRPVTALDRCYLESWIGFERSMGMVRPEIRVVVVCPSDLAVGELDVDLRGWLPTLVDELAAPQPVSAFYRDGRRCASVIREAPAVGAAGGPVVRPDGTYLVTGGMGGLGLIIARHLARTAPVNLVLTGRSELTERQRGHLAELEASGGRVRYLRADICDEAAMRHGLAQARASFGPVRGVVHAAGVESRSTVLDLDAAAFEALLMPKVAGALVLDRLLAGDPVDFVCHFSSSSAILGDFGSCGYAVANRFQTAFAAHRSGRSLAINWPLWTDGGMSLSSDAGTELYLRSSGQRGLGRAEGIAVFERLLAEGGVHQRLVMAGDPERIRRLLRVDRTPRDEPPPTAAPTGPPATVLAKPPAAVPAGAAAGTAAEVADAAEVFRQDLRAEAGALLRIPRQKLTFDHSLADLGFDSISLTAFAGVLSRRFGIALAPAVFFDHPTLESLSAFYLDRHPDAVRAHYAQRAMETVAPEPAPANAGTTARDDSAFPEPIAIIGMSGRFPGARTVDELWSILDSGRDVVTDVPDERFPGHGGRWRAGLVPGVGEFDPLFFEITPADAHSMDPRQRLLLQEAWNGLEDAGYGSSTVDRVGMFVGAEAGDYAGLLTEPGGVTANHDGVLASRLSYFLNFSGPALTLNTACSSGLTAVHQACWSLRNGDCDTAIAAGVNLLTTAASFVTADEAGMLSPDGRCYAFDKRANGMVPGEAVAVVVLKRLSRAEADRDRILGVITASGLNYDGKTNGITAPGGRSQADLVRGVHRRYGLQPADVDCVFAHGTGTRLGDPVEINALSEAFGPPGDGTDRALVAVKPALGHTFAASGVVSLIGLVQALRHGILPPSLHCEQLSDYVDWSRSGFAVNTTRRVWPRRPGRPRSGAVSAFGISGTNAHVVVREYAEPPPATPARAAHLLVLSARTERALDRLTARLSAFLRADGADVDLARVSWTLLTGRRHHRHRRAVVVRTVAEAAAALSGAITHAGTDVRGTVDREFRPQPTTLTDAERMLARCGTEPERVLPALAELYCAGYGLAWERLFGDPTPLPVSLPHYPFERDHYWAPAAATGTGLLVTAPVWTEAPPPAAGRIGDRTVVLCGTAVPDPSDGTRYVLLDAGSGDVAERFETATVTLIELLQNLQRGGAAEGHLVQVVVSTSGRGKWFHGLAAVLATVRAEVPALRTQFVEVDADRTPTDLRALLDAEAADPSDARVRHSDGRRRVLRWEPVAEPAAEPAPPWRDGGVYLFTGGLGIAAILAAEIAGRTTGTTFVLAGRSRADEDRLAELRTACGPTCTVEHRRADVTDRAQVQALVHGIVRDFGRLTGVVHTAGVLRDSFVLRTSAESVREVLGPKVRGVMLLDEATRGLPLDLFVLCSSVAGVLGNTGQAAYAAANAFMDTFAADRASRAGGRTLSVNWPLWADGGMRVDATTTAVMRTVTGMVPMRTATAIEALHRALATGHAQVMVMEGTPERMSDHLAGVGRREPAVPVGPTSGEVEVLVGHRTTALFATVTGLAVEQIDRDEPLETYGIDSMHIAKLNQLLARPFDRLPKTLFFEYRTLSAVSEYLVRRFPLECAAWVSAGPVPPPAPPVRPDPADPPGVGRARTDRSASRRFDDEPVAIIGMSGRFPGAATVDAFWDNLRSGKSLITEIPPDRWPLNGFYVADVEEAIASGRSYGKWGGFIDGFADFDPAFFRLPPREVLDMDPQERLFLQESWRTFEDAAYTRERMARQHKGRVGVFVGITRTGFELHNNGQRRHLTTNFSRVANRVSYVFDLHGPSLPIDTMCSSSLSAVHEACEHLRRGSCEMAVAGGVNVYTHPSAYVEFSRMRMLSPDGECRAFGANANGMVPGEGVAAVLLKPLSRAVADGDHVYAVIPGSSINHDGRTNGFTVPNPAAQRDVVRAALDRAGVDARTVSYVEAHGTGTNLGDPIEVAALTHAFRADTDETRFCAIGSAKPGIGHLEAAAGIAGLVKIVLQLGHGQLAPSLNADELNTNIDFADSPFHVQRQLTDWERAGSTPRTAGLSSFGAGGSNAHVIVQEHDGR